MYELLFFCLSLLLTSTRKTWWTFISNIRVCYCIKMRPFNLHGCQNLEGSFMVPATQHKQISVSFILLYADEKWCSSLECSGGALYGIQNRNKINNERASPVICYDVRTYIYLIQFATAKVSLVAPKIALKPAPHWRSAQFIEEKNSVKNKNTIFCLPMILILLMFSNVPRTVRVIKK